MTLRTIALALALSLPATAGMALLPGVAQAGEPTAEETAALEAIRGKQLAIVELVERRTPDDELQQSVDGLLDYAWLAQAALGGKSAATEACGGDCSEFEDLLTQLVRRNYMQMLRKAAGTPIDYVDAEAGRGGLFKVTTKIKIAKNGRKQTIEVAYVVFKAGDAWIVRDIITDGVSLTKTYRFEFNKTLKKDGFPALIQKMKDKLAKGDI
jgi:phospholipid transport system substrate-binding protein